MTATDGLFLVDAWIQHPTPAFLRDELFATLRRWMGLADDAIPALIPDEFTLAALDQARVSVTLVSAWWAPQGPLLDNDSVANLVRRFPDRLAGIASVNLDKPMPAVRELRRCVKQLGMKGLRILPWLWRSPPNDRRYYPLYA